MARLICPAQSFLRVTSGLVLGALESGAGE